MFVVLLVVYAISYAAFVIVEMAVFAVVAVAVLAASGIHLQVSRAMGITGFGVIAVGLFALLLLWMSIIWAAYAISLAVLYEDQRLRMTMNGDTAPIPGA
jgi:hypothetical protein